MEFTGERCIIGKSGDLLEKEHLARYEFAIKYVCDKKVLDIGCGAGYGVDLLSSKASEAIGVDISEEAINYAKQRYKKKDVNFFVGDATYLPFFENKEFDVVVSFEVIEHITNRSQFLKEIRRVLKNSGTLIISTPNKKYHSLGSEKPLNIFHVIEFELDDFKKLLREYFEDVTIYGQYYDSKIKSFVKKILPTKAWKALKASLESVYHTKQASSFNNKNVENHSYFIAVCNK